MLCQACEVGLSSVHVTEIEEGKKTEEAHYCADCAEREVKEHKEAITSHKNMTLSWKNWWEGFEGSTSKMSVQAIAGIAFQAGWGAREKSDQ